MTVVTSRKTDSRKFLARAKGMATLLLDDSAKDVRTKYKEGTCLQGFVLGDAPHKEYAGCIYVSTARESDRIEDIPEREEHVAAIFGKIGEELRLREISLAYYGPVEEVEALLVDAFSAWGYRESIGFGETELVQGEGSLPLRLRAWEGNQKDLYFVRLSFAPGDPIANLGAHFALERLDIAERNAGLEYPG
ncbi:MAG: hypothetical protein V1820_04755 [archaeon]